MSKIDHYYWEDEVAKETPRPLVFGVSKPPNGNRKERFTRASFRFPNCRHWRQRFALNNGLHVYASAWSDEPSPNRAGEHGAFEGDPDIGFYLDRCWAKGRVLASPGCDLPGRTKPSSQVVVYPCEDWGAPDNPKMFWSSLKWLLKQAQKGMIVDIGCMGGHGRTGTALACLLVLQGTRPKTAIRRVRTKYCEEAIESDEQVKFIFSTTHTANPRPVRKQPGASR